jgi:hypothetical protein
VDKTWAGLPRHYWAVVGRAKPGAMTLATAAEGERKPGDGRDREQALIVRHNYGLGRVLFVGLDSTWRWRHKVGDRFHHAFWGDTIHWAASDKALGAGNEFVRFGTTQPVYRKGDRPEVVVRFTDEMGPVKPDLLAAARILKQKAPGEKDEAVALVPLRRREARPRVLEGAIPGLPPGQYAVELVIPELADKLRPEPARPGAAGEGKAAGPMRAPFTLLPPESTEKIDLGTNWPLLEQLALKSGGKVFAPEDAGALAELLASQTVPHVEHQEQRLWQWWVLLSAVLALLTLEWAGRKLAGLP